MRRGQDLVTSDAKTATVRKRKSISSRVKHDSDSDEAEFVPTNRRRGSINPIVAKRRRGMLFEMRSF